MKKLGLIALASLSLLLAASPAWTQGYQAPEQPNANDVYCSGFVASHPLPANLRIVMGEDALGRLVYSQYDYVYLGKGADGGLSVGQRFLVVRPVDSPSSPEIDAFKGEHELTREMRKPWYEKKYIGQYYQDIGQVEVRIVNPTTATALVTAACDALNPGDVLIPMEERPVPEYKPTDAFDRFAPPSGKAIGTILPGKDFAYVMGQGDFLYTALGSNDGVVVGDYLRLFRAATGTNYEGYKGINRGQWRRYRGMPEGELIPLLRPDLPREVAGEALVLRVDEKSATALITYSLREVHAGDFAEVEPPAAPQATLTVVPDTIQRGQSATLSWSARLATEHTIAPGIGPVTSRTGSRNVSPTQTTTYTLSIAGRGGEDQATATLTVVQPPPPPPPPPPPAAGPSLQDLFNQNVQDIFFEFDRSEFTAEAQSILQRVGGFLRDNPQARILVEGHCDEVGTEQYNMALGARRAQATRDYLVSQGVSAGQLDTVSVGKSRPFCSDSRKETCRGLNRRAHFVLR